VAFQYTLSFPSMSSGRRVRIWDCSKLFTKDNLVSVITDVVVSLDLDLTASASSTSVSVPVSHSDGDSIFCTSCHVSISDTSHYKSDWHRLNAKLRAVGAKPVTQSEFEQHELETDLVDEEEYIEERLAQSTTSNTSSSLDINASTGSARITFITRDHETLSVWKSLLLPGKTGTIAQYANAALKFSQPIPSIFSQSQRATSSSEKDTSSPQPLLSPAALSALPQHPFQWIIFLCQGGFFAGAVFRGDQVLKHKRIAKYTVRRKQGGSQASKDQSKGGIHSAGASIRRYNETRLREEIAELLQSWRVDIQQSSCIFLHAPSFNSASFFFEGSPISRRDSRVRSIPIVTQRPSFVELQRIHLILSTVEISHFTGIEDLRSSMEAAQLGSKSGEEKSVVSPDGTSSLADSSSIRSSSSSIYSLTEGEHADWASDSASIGALKLSSTEVAPVDLLAAAIDTGDEDRVRHLLLDEDYLFPIPEKAEALVWPLMRATQLSNASMVRCLIDCGEPLDGRSPKYALKTVLHVACEHAWDELVALLLSEGANPTLQDMYGLTAYETCKEKSTRNAVRKFAGANPELWEWEKARVPPLTDEMEETARAKDAEKRKRKKAAQKERKKAQKEEEALQAQEEVRRNKANEEERLEKEAALERTKRILGMSEREKRALAAERRLNPSANTCDNCGKQILTQPYEKFSFKYCSSACVVEHKRILDALQASSSTGK